MSSEKRFILAIVVSFVVVALWSTFFMPKPPEPQTPAETETVEDPSVTPGETGQEQEGEDPQTETSEASQLESAVPEEPVYQVADAEILILIETDRYRVEMSNVGGGSAQSWKVKKQDGTFYEASFSKEPLDLVAAPKLRREPFHDLGTAIRDPNGEYLPFPGLPVVSGDYDGQQAVFRDGKATINFTYADESFGTVVKEFTFYQNSYVVDVSLSQNVKGLDSDSALVMVMGPGIGDLLKPKGETEFEPAREANGFLFRKGNESVSRAPSMVSDAKKPEGDTKGLAEGIVNEVFVWAGLENNYFMSLAFGDSNNAFFPVYRLNSVKEVQSGGATKYFAFPYLALKTVRNNASFKLYIGPKDLTVLETAANGRLKDVVTFGWFSFVSRPALWVLQQLHSFTGNWGFSIILLTIILNIILLPLILKQRKSMAAMQVLQPQIKAIQAKYKAERGDDIKTRQAKKQKLNEETMALYKRENINPMGGCLPLLIQLPILIALFDMIRVAIELRKAPFILWWDNLSVADPTYVLPILMGAAMFLTQKITPAAADSQAGALKFLPFIFVFLFASAPSGLVLYWLTSSLFNLGTQLVMGKIAPVVPAKDNKKKISSNSSKQEKKKSRSKK